MSWKDDFAYGRQFLRDIRAIVGFCLVHEAPIEEDVSHATDLLVLRLEAWRVAVRIRRPDAFAKWSDEFTIRSLRESGTETELAKIMGGWGDAFLYGFGHDSGSSLLAWTLIDLDEFRTWWWERVRLTGCAPGHVRWNHEARGVRTQFTAFRISDLPPAAIRARYSPTCAVPVAS